MSESTRELFDKLAQVLLRCWVFGFLALLAWFGAYVLAGDVIRELHGGMFELSRHDFDVIHYSGMALLKLFVIVCYLFPWLAVKLVLGKEKG